MSIHAFGALRKGRASGGGGDTVLGWFSDWATQTPGGFTDPDASRQRDTIGGTPKWTDLSRRNNGSIIAVTGMPFTRAIKVEHRGVNDSYKLWIDNLDWDTGDVVTIRWYEKYEQLLSYGGLNNHHGIGNSQGNSTTNWSLNTSYWEADDQYWVDANWLFGQGADETYFGAWGSSGRGSQVGNNNYANQPLYLKIRWYMKVAQLWRRSGTTYSIRHWMYDAEDNNALVHDPSDYYNIPGTITLDDDPVLTLDKVEPTADVRAFCIGHNGMGTPTTTPMPFMSFAAVGRTNALPWGTPLGPYGTVTDGTTTEGE